MLAKAERRPRNYQVEYEGTLADLRDRSLIQEVALEELGQ